MKRPGFTTTRKPMKQVSAKRRNQYASSEGKAPIKQKDKPKSALTMNAKGQDCTLRLSQCRHDPDYTVLCHIRRNGWGGMSIKPNDLLAFFACDKCHEMQERHNQDCTDADILRALGETLMEQERDGIITIGEIQ